VRDRDKLAAEIPAHPLAEEGPVYPGQLAQPALRKEPATDWFHLRPMAPTSRIIVRSCGASPRLRREALDHTAVRYLGAYEHVGRTGRERMPRL